MRVQAIREDAFREREERMSGTVQDKRDAVRDGFKRR